MKIIRDKSRVSTDKNGYTAITNLKNINIKLGDYYQEKYSYDPELVTHAIEAMKNLTGEKCHMFLPKEKKGAMPLIIVGDNGSEDPPVYLVAPIGGWYG